MNFILKLIFNLLNFSIQIIFDAFSEAMYLSKAKSNLWREVRHVPSIKRVTKLFLGVFVISLILLSTQIYHFGWFAPEGKAKEIFGYNILDHDFNRINQWSVPIVATVVLIWAGQIYVVSKRLETIAYRIMKAFKKK